jgi:hypothetical protein
VTELHYPFPPASAYPLNRCLFALKSDAEFRERYRADPTAALDGLGLGARERAALSTLDRDQLVGLGAHPYLVFMADLRLRMARGGGSFEHF